jgi:hypothetical protein
MTLLGTLCGFGLLTSETISDRSDQPPIPHKMPVLANSQILPSKKRMRRTTNTMPIIPIPPWP